MLGLVEAGIIKWYWILNIKTALFSLENMKIVENNPTLLNLDLKFTDLKH
jgi:hypothetical protein